MYKVLNWQKANFTTVEGSKQVKEAINLWLKAPKVAQEKVAHLTVRGDFPADGYPYLEKIRQEVIADDGWLSAFTEIPFVTADGAGGESGFDVAIGGSAIILAEVADGAKAKVYQAQGESVRVPFNTYAGAIMYMKTLIEDGRWWDMEDNLNAIRNAFYNCRADVHYGLIEAVGAGNNIAWQDQGITEEFDNQVASDAATINAACIDIINSANGWQGINAKSTFSILTPLELVPRMRRALKPSERMFITEPVSFNVNIVPTNSFATKTVYYVVPTGKAGRTGLRKDLEIEFQGDILINSETMVGRSRFGAAVFDTVVRRCAIS